MDTKFFFDFRNLRLQEIKKLGEWTHGQMREFDVIFTKQVPSKQGSQHSNAVISFSSQLSILLSRCY